MICKGEKHNFPVSDLSKWNLEERLTASHSRKTKHNFFLHAGLAQNNSQRALCWNALWGVSTDPALPHCLLQRLYKNNIYAFVAGCQNWKYQPRSFK